jgi:4-amino-4-deoxy-L-arabinose transferase-like glycosyltransferase
MRLNYKSLAISLFIFGSILRILLCWANPPDNAFDNHFEPIFMIMDSGTVPAKDACWQCYHPPVFYWVSAMIGNIALGMGISLPLLVKLLQFISCFYGILTLVIIYLILRKLPSSNFSRLTAFGTVCFLPRHIYMSAMNSNDTMSYLFVALSIYLLLIAIERELNLLILLALSISISITLFTKYTSYVVLPIIFIVFTILYYKRLIVPRKQVLFSFILVLLLPMSILTTDFIWNLRNYGSPLPWNVTLQDPSLTHPRDSNQLDFFSFKPWESINMPIIVPGKMHSFWTLIYDGMWFDNEPRFLYFLSPRKYWSDNWQDWLRGEKSFPEDYSLSSVAKLAGEGPMLYNWWAAYFLWLNGKMSFPGANPPLSNLTKLLGSGLIVFGLFPLLLILKGMYNYFRDWRKNWIRNNEIDMVKMSIYPTLLFANAGGIIALALRLPVYSAAKASYFLNSLPAFAVFLSYALMSCEKNKILMWIVVTLFGVLFALVSLHILQIFQFLM